MQAGGGLPVEQSSPAPASHMDESGSGNATGDKPGSGETAAGQVADVADGSDVQVWLLGILSCP
jgi:hypothetical protein